MTALTRLVRDLSKSEAELGRFETRFGVKSPEFYEAMMRGDLEEFDALDEYRMEFIEWLALYKTWLSFGRKVPATDHPPAGGPSDQGKPGTGSCLSLSPRHRHIRRSSIA